MWFEDPDGSATFIRAHRLHSWAGLTTSLLLVAWLLASVYADGPQFFQRAGSLGVAFAVIALTFERVTFQKYEEYFELRNWYQNRERISWLHNAVFDDVEPMEIVHQGATREFLFQPPERPLYRPLDSSKKHGRNILVLEISWLSISTIQWGYGDLFYCWLSGFGWKVCY